MTTTSHATTTDAETTAATAGKPADAGDARAPRQERPAHDASDATATPTAAPQASAVAPPQDKPKATIYDVAERAGVSYATVSRYLNGHPNVAAKTAARIDKAIAETDYTPSANARSLAQQRTHLIALIIHGQSQDILTDPNILQIMASANARVTEEGWQLVTLMSENDTSTQNIARMVAGGFADGYLLFTLERHDPILDVFAKRPIPAAISGTGFKEVMPCPSVDVDNLGAMSGLVRHVLMPDGHTLERRHPAYICGPMNMPGAPERMAAFVNVTNELLPTGEDHPVSYVDDWKTASGAAVVHGWHEDGTLEGLDAIVCANDTLAVGVIEELHRLGRAVPRDVAVSGFDNSVAATSITPALTTVDQHMELRGRVMAQIVIDAINGIRSPHTVYVDTDLVVRQSA
ncbi:LacI family DNA-binding transcriptional regulator [Bifidobacterium sp. CP2]|uniref:LacI family DNA-binding transcriptional regulator n=1 Tax=Bifidobacterium sp. CP2 TaxID=2809025 RepID=UPI001BDC9313|nr:LacI family DNA-binding transcriptional regulator [Bifidobacterium sp. CP2]MBT1181775.1 LacI family DNA-binding transcriptional regulator [Bifidobacterium sp. CP2]